MITKRNYQFRALVMMSVATLAAVLLVMLPVAVRPAHASTTFTVNTTADFPDADLDDPVNVCDADIFLRGKQCTLRAAIEEANHTVGADAITFNIREEVDPGVKTIQPTSELPTITEQVTIDGYTQPGSSPNTLANGTNAKLLIELNGQSAGSDAIGLEVQAPNTVVRGLVINRFSQVALLACCTGITGVRIEGNFIGTDPTGTVDLGNSRDGVELNEASNSTVGGSTPDKHNLISSNNEDGVSVVGFSTDNNNNNKVQGNLIGTQKDGSSRLGNTGGGVAIPSGENTTVGGSSAASANTIAFNGFVGVHVLSGTGNRVLLNSIFSNNSLGIDLANNGPTQNDVGDADLGPNELQNKPLIRRAVTSGGKTTIKAKLSSKPNQSYVVRFFSNPSGTDEGKRYMGQEKVTTGSDGKASFVFTPARKVRLGKAITATATDASANTSEF